MVKNRMATVLIEQEEKKYTEGKKSEVLQAFADIEAPFLELLEEAEKVKNIEEEHTKTIQNMGERKEKIKRQMIEVKTNLDQRKMSIKEAIEAAEERRVSVTNQIEVAKKTIVTVTNKIKDTKVAYEAKMEEKETLDKKLNKLRKIFGFAKCKTENSKQLYDTFFTELKNLEVRTDWDKRTIEYILLSRRETLQRKTIEYQTALDENLHLAQEYQRDLIRFLEVKNWYLDECNKKTTKEAAIKDKKRILLLQERMHAALLEYFRLQTLLSKCKLELTQQRAHGNMCRVIHVELSFLHRRG
uniref:Coiled-coil domain-containing protein 178-like isoform X2 n=1 Tax=Phascolarctos cinereus TaxID=38626 RepID=A0A6P5KTV0_PHACI|nr:coiled-coil domain-containing protein 178-like isoform X2 [Phascolarctos cinereus]